MQIYVSEQRRSHGSLRRTHFRLRPLAVFRYSRLQPFLNQAKYPTIGHPMLDEPHRPFVAQVIEGKHDTLPIISTFRSELPSSVLAIHSKAGRSTFLDRFIAKVDCISF